MIIYTVLLKCQMIPTKSVKYHGYAVEKAMRTANEGASGATLIGATKDRLKSNLSSDGVKRHDFRYENL